MDRKEQKELLPKRVLRVIPNVDSVDQNFSVHRIEESKHELCYRGFTTAGCTHYAHRGTRRDLEGYILQHSLLLSVVKVNRLELYFWRSRRVGLVWFGSEPVLDLHLLFHQGKHVLHVDEALLDHTVDGAQEVERGHQLN